MGFNLDNLSLMALTLSVGFVVDDAIVMLENIVRHMEEGESAFEAALIGSREIGLPSRPRSSDRARSASPSCP
ncbi:MAG: acriflavin resistance protein, partial [candidate division NC10 bacterium]|nr:acriflavin resistance protein [candidate division NC10 bacterium]